MLMANGAFEYCNTHLGDAHFLIGIPSILSIDRIKMSE